VFLEKVLQSFKKNGAGKGFCNKRSFLQKSTFAHERKTKQETCLVYYHKIKKKEGDNDEIVI
jgi:hypothetical protein